MAGLNISIEIDEIPDPQIDEQHIQEWIEARLNDARNLFIQRVSRGGGGGRIYKRTRRRGVYHQASAPGEYPVTDGGRLVGSVGPPQIGQREGSLYSNVEYAELLAKGTPGGQMAARLMLQDAIQEVLDNRPRNDVLAQAAKLR